MVRDIRVNSKSRQVAVKILIKINHVVQKIMSRINMVSNVTDVNEMIANLNYYETTWLSDCYEKKWRNMLMLYKKINVYFFRVDAIGEAIPAFCCFYNLNKRAKEQELNVYIPLVGQAQRKLNNELLVLFRNRLNIILPEDAMFWKYVVLRHRDELCLDNLRKVTLRREYPQFMVPIGEALLPISDDLLQYGNEIKSILNISGQYVCFIARTATVAANFL